MKCALFCIIIFIASLGTALAGHAILRASIPISIVVDGQVAGQVTAQGGSIVTLLETNDTQALIALNGTTNWVDKAKLKIPEPQVLPTPSPETGYSDLPTPKNAIFIGVDPHVTTWLFEAMKCTATRLDITPEEEEKLSDAAIKQLISTADILLVNNARNKSQPLKSISHGVVVDIPNPHSVFVESRLKAAAEEQGLVVVWPNSASANPIQSTDTNCLVQASGKNIIYSITDWKKDHWKIFNAIEAADAIPAAK